MNYKSDEFSNVMNWFTEINELYFKSYTNKINIRHKGKMDLVTSVDYEIEKYLIDNISRAYPNDNIISGETRNNGTIDGRNWVIDPLDGTCNFAAGIPMYGVQMALTIKDEPIMSFIMLPKLNEVYYAEKGNGAYLNGGRIRVNNDINKDSAIISFGDFSREYAMSSYEQINIMAGLKTKAFRVKMFGASCYELAFIASGRTHGHLMYGKNLWDLLPGALLIKEAGGIVTNLDGTDLRVGAGGILAAVNEDILKMLIVE